MLSVNRFVINYYYLSCIPDFEMQATLITAVAWTGQFKEILRRVETLRLLIWTIIDGLRDLMWRQTVSVQCAVGWEPLMREGDGPTLLSIWRRNHLPLWRLSRDQHSQVQKKHKPAGSSAVASNSQRFLRFRRKIHVRELRFLFLGLTTIKKNVPTYLDLTTHC